MKTGFPKILGLIPARMGSRGVIGKNMKLLGSKPLIEYTMEAALGSRLLHKIVVSTDCPLTAGFANNFEGISAPFLRPAHLATDHSAMADVVLHALEYAQSQWEAFEYVVVLQPTSPFRMPGMINGALRQILTEHADSLVSVRKIPDTFNPFWAYYRHNDHIEPVITDAVPRITRRQDLPAAFHRDGQIYIARTALVLEGMLTGGQISAWYNDDDFGVNIDTMADWLQAENLLEKWKKQAKSPF